MDWSRAGAALDGANDQSPASPSRGIAISDGCSSPGNGSCPTGPAASVKVPLGTPGLLAKMRSKLAAVDVTNTMARIAWAIMAEGGYYRAPEPAAAA
jgi:hypothetical protein